LTNVVGCVEPGVSGAKVPSAFNVISSRVAEGTILCPALALRPWPFPFWKKSAAVRDYGACRAFLGTLGGKIVPTKQNGAMELSARQA
jgi:hypothetical protein